MLVEEIFRLKLSAKTETADLTIMILSLLKSILKKNISFVKKFWKRFKT